MNAKTCRQCGELKPLAQFRQYYGGRTGTYTICKTCEKINSRLKYLERKGESMSQTEEAERDKIMQLYEAQRAMGLRPPQRGERETPAPVDLDAMLAKYVPAVSDEPKYAAETTPELTKWLSAELTEDPDYYLDEVYDGLVDKFRPVLSIDQATMMPKYDDTYKDMLDKILQRFYDYEADYYNEEDE